MPPLLPFFYLAVFFISNALSLDTSHLPCGVPFALTDENLFKYSALINSTISDLARGNTSDHVRRSADLFGQASNLFTGCHPWPRQEKTNKHPNRLVVIWYCYANYETSQRFRKDLDQAIGAWMTALGGEASKESGHGLEFREIGGSKPEYCYEDGDPKECASSW
jgi:hypothetical protein